MSVCEFCESSFTSKYILKTHLKNNKKCLKLRGENMDNDIKCKGCSIVLTHQSHLFIHQETCKEYIKYDYDQVIMNIKNELYESKKSEDILNSKNKELNKEMIVKDQTILMQEKLIKDLRESYERIAKEAVNRPTTINHIRNNLSTVYTLDEMKEKELIELFRENFTENVFMSGQKGLAKLCTDKIINTKDSKKLICCTDITRKKFKYMDKNGNLIEDVEAREFVNKMYKPIREVGQHIYDIMISNIDDERDNINPEDYNKKDKLTTQSFQVMDRYKDIINIDDPKYNTEFTTELAILNKQ